MEDIFPPELIGVIRKYAPRYKINDVSHVYMAPNDKIPPDEHCIDKFLDICSGVQMYKLTACDHPYAVERYLQSVNMIRHYLLCKNRYATQYYLSNTQHIVWSSFVQNPSDEAVMFTIANDKAIIPEFSANPNDMAIDWLLEHSQYIDKYFFTVNTNKRALCYMLSHHMGPKYSMIALNKSPLIIKWLIKRYWKISEIARSGLRFNIVAQEYLLRAGIQDVLWQICSRLDNDYVIDYLSHHQDKIDKFAISINPHPWAAQYCREHNIERRIFYERLPDDS